MQVLTIINSIAIAVIAVYLLRRFISRLELRIERTFWEKKPHGVQVMTWERPRWRQAGSNSGSGQTFNWINPDRLGDSIEGKRQNEGAHGGKLVPQGVPVTIWEGLRGKTTP